MSFGGNWKSDKADNFEEYMKEVGVGLITRKAAANLSITLEITEDGDHFVWKQFSTLKNHTFEFTIGKEFDETTPDGRSMKSTIVRNGDKLVQTQKAVKSGDKDSIITRWIENGVLHITAESGSVKCHRTYVRA